VPTGIKPATDLAFAPRNAVNLSEVVQRDVPELDLKSAAAATIAAPIDPKVDPKLQPSIPATPPVTSGVTKKSGCGCQSGGEPAGFALVGFAVLVLRRRRRA
jgi:MYXO-CTERM domain-containing protein